MSSAACRNGSVSKTSRTHPLCQLRHQQSPGPGSKRGVDGIASVLGERGCGEKCSRGRRLSLSNWPRSLAAMALVRRDDGLSEYALSRWVQIVEAGRRMGRPLHKEARIRLMLESPLRAHIRTPISRDNRQRSDWDQQFQLELQVGGGVYTTSWHGIRSLPSRRIRQISPRSVG